MATALATGLNFSKAQIRGWFAGRTGIIASGNSGVAIDVAYHQVVAVADSEAGISVFGIFRA
jgi:hypothetical protein